MPETPAAAFARSENSVPRRLPGCISNPIRAAKFESLMPRMQPLLKSVFLMTLLAEWARRVVTSTICACTFLTPRSSRCFFISRSLACRAASVVTSSGMSLSSCAPFISTRVPPGMETLTSWRIVPRPRFVFPVLRRRRPIFSATSMHCSGL